MTVNFRVEKETEKAVLVETQVGYAANTDRSVWLPKSAVTIETYVQTVNILTNEPETFGKRVTEIPSWLARKYNYFN